MKKGIWIIVAALLSLGAIIGANALVSTTNVNTMKKKLSTEEQIKIAPKAAVDSATVALKKALSQQNAPAVIAALVKQSAAQLLIDRDSLPAIIDKTTALADRSENPVEQSLLRLLTAQMYNLYLDRNYQIRWRDEIDDFSLPVESWSKNMFTEKIDTLLAQADSLFRPTLYDFVLNEAIEIYEGMDEYSRIQPLVRQKLLSPAKEFTAAVSSGKTIKDNRILQLYADALKFHAADELSARLHRSIKNDSGRLPGETLLGRNRHRSGLETTGIREIRRRQTSPRHLRPMDKRLSEISPNKRTQKSTQRTHREKSIFQSAQRLLSGSNR